MINPSDYKPNYIDRSYETCPHCQGENFTRTNRYLYRCTNANCGRYW